MSIWEKGHREDLKWGGHFLEGVWMMLLSVTFKADQLDF